MASRNAILSFIVRNDLVTGKLNNTTIYSQILRDGTLMTLVRQRVQPYQEPKVAIH